MAAKRTVKKAARKAAKKPAAKKAAARKASPRKASKKKASPRKSATDQAKAGQTRAGKPRAGKAPTKKAAKKATTAGTPRRKAAPAKTAAAKTPAAKTPAAKTSVRRTATKKAATAKKPARRRPAPPAAPAARPQGLVRVLQEDGTVDASAAPALDETTLLYLYEQMVQVREFDRRMLMLQRQGRIGFYGPILGQEAATVGSVAALEHRDWIFPALREGAAAMMRGLSLTEAVNQLIGNGADRCKGRQMPCHYTVKEGNYYGMSSVIGTQISHATGAAMAARLRGDDTVVLGYMGDGATSANDFHCGMNFAAVYKSPCIMFCQNNQWAISVPLSQQSASETLAQKGKAYGMPYVRVDGNDVLAVYSVTREAAARARAGSGPTFIEAVTYRRLGHSSSDDPTKYRDEAEVKLWEQRDPIDRFRTYLVQRELWDDAKEAAFKEDIAQRVNDAIAAAEQEPPPEDETLVTDVYARVTLQQEEQLAEVLALEGRGVNTGAFPL